MKTRTYSLLVISFLYVMLGCAQDFSYKKIENTYGKFIEKPDLAFVSVENYLPEGFVKDGSIDYTEFIQRAINENENVEFPNFPLLINDKGLRLRSNSNVYFNKDSKLLLKPSNKGRYEMLLIKGVQNLNLYNPTLIGDRKNHLGEQGEWGMGISVEDSDDIDIYNMNISDMWGDGLYVRTTRNETGGNLRVKYGSIDNARRNGISVISAKNTLLDSIQISNTNGHNPASGVDVEPNRKHIHVIKAVTLKNIFTYNNEKDGIVISLSNLINSKIGNQVELMVLNHKDIGSRLGLRFPKAGNARVTDRDDYLSGSITIDGAEWLETRTRKPFNIRKENTHMPKVIMKNIRTDRMEKKEFERTVKKTIEPLERFEFHN